jgi:hypothetical protein
MSSREGSGASSVWNSGRGGDRQSPQAGCVAFFHIQPEKKEVNEMKTRKLRLEELEQRIAPSEVGQGLGIGNPGNNNPPANNTNHPGNEGTGGQVSTGA